MPKRKADSWPSEILTDPDVLSLDDEGRFVLCKVCHVHYAVHGGKKPKPVIMNSSFRTRAWDVHKERTNSHRMQKKQEELRHHLPPSTPPSQQQQQRQPPPPQHGEERLRAARSASFRLEHEHKENSHNHHHALPKTYRKNSETVAQHAYGDERRHATKSAAAVASLRSTYVSHSRSQTPTRPSRNPTAASTASNMKSTASSMLNGPPPSSSTSTGNNTTTTSTSTNATQAKQSVPSSQQQPQRPGTDPASNAAVTNLLAAQRRPENAHCDSPTYANTSNQPSSRPSSPHVMVQQQRSMPRHWSSSEAAPMHHHARLASRSQPLHHHQHPHPHHHTQESSHRHAVSSSTAGMMRWRSMHDDVSRALDGPSKRLYTDMHMGNGDSHAVSSPLVETEDFGDNKERDAKKLKSLDDEYMAKYYKRSAPHYHRDSANYKEYWGTLRDVYTHGQTANPNQNNPNNNSNMAVNQSHMPTDQHPHNSAANQLNAHNGSSHAVVSNSLHNNSSNSSNDTSKSSSNSNNNNNVLPPLRGNNRGNNNGHLMPNASNESAEDVTTPDDADRSASSSSDESHKATIIHDQALVNAIDRLTGVVSKHLFDRYTKVTAAAIDALTGLTDAVNDMRTRQDSAFSRLIQLQEQRLQVEEAILQHKLRKEAAIATAAATSSADAATAATIPGPSDATKSRLVSITVDTTANTRPSTATATSLAVSTSVSSAAEALLQASASKHTAQDELSESPPSSVSS